MNVAQLIAALAALPPDLPILAEYGASPDGFEPANRLLVLHPEQGDGPQAGVVLLHDPEAA